MKKIILTSFAFLSMLGLVSIVYAASPVVTAGVAQSITLPTSSVALSGSAVFSAPATAVISYAWVLTSGPTVSPAVAIAQPLATAAAATATGLTAPGNYVFTLTATDNATPTVFTGTATTTITVNAAPVLTPTPLPIVKRMRLNIEQNGKVYLQGNILSLGTNTMTVNVWGLTFTINTTNAKIGGRLTDVTHFSVGDSVQVSGRMDNTTSTPTVLAKNLRNMTVQTSKDRNNRNNEKDRENNHDNKGFEDKNKGWKGN